MHCLAVVICKIQSSYSTKSYFQRDGRLARPNGCRLKPLGRWGFFFFLRRVERRTHIFCSFKVLIHRRTGVALLSCPSRSSWQITIITVSPHRSSLLTHIIQTKEVFDTLPNHCIHLLSFFFFAWALSLSCAYCVCGCIFSNSEVTAKPGPPDLMKHLWKGHLMCSFCNILESPCTQFESLFVHLFQCLTDSCISL